MSALDAEDLVANTMLVAWRRLEDVLAADEPLAWLYGVAYRTLANQRRSRARAQALATRMEGQGTRTQPGTEDTVAARAELEKVTQAMSRLTERDREILRLAAFEDLTPAGIAAVLDISPARARTALYRARQRLRKALAEVGAAGEPAT